MESAHPAALLPTRSARALQIQGWVFGISMILVAGYVAFA
jgi:hypothetical protein